MEIPLKGLSFLIAVLAREQRDGKQGSSEVDGEHVMISLGMSQLAPCMSKSDHP